VRRHLNITLPFLTESLDPSSDLELDFGIESTPFAQKEMNSNYQQAVSSATQPLAQAISPVDEMSSSSAAFFNFEDSPGTTPPYSPDSSLSSSQSVSSYEEPSFFNSRSSSVSNLSFTPPVLPPSAPLPAGLPTITTAFLPTDIASPISMLQTPTTQYGSPADDSLDALFAQLCQGLPQPAECANFTMAFTQPTGCTNFATPFTQPAENTNLTTAFTKPDQVALRSLLDDILASNWLNTHAPEPKDEKNRSLLLGFLAHEGAGGGTYRCLFDGCNKLLDRQDRALGHIRMHVHHRPFGCNGVCGVPECQERFYCQSYLRSHAKRQKLACDIW
jgi:hypothetical protein